MVKIVLLSLELLAQRAREVSLPQAASEIESSLADDRPERARFTPTFRARLFPCRQQRPHPRPGFADAQGQAGRENVDLAGRGLLAQAAQQFGCVVADARPLTQGQEAI